MSDDHDASQNHPQVPSYDDWLNEAASWWSLALADAGSAFRARLDKEAKDWLSEGRPNAELTDFDRDFMREVCPRLQPWIRLGAALVSQNLERFSEAHDRVMHAAVKLGYAELSDTAQFDLDDWIDHAILAWIDQPPPKGLITVERLSEITRIPPAADPETGETP